MIRYNKYLASVLIMSTFFLSAPNVRGVAHNLSGVWMGVAVGSATSGSTSYKATLNNDTVLKNDTPLKGFLGEILAGVQKDFGKVVVGGELVIGFGTAKTSKKLEPPQEYKADQKAVLEIAARLGFKVSDTVQVYARAGGAMTNFERQIPVDEGLTAVKIKQKSKLFGVVLGFGVEAKIMEQFLVGLEVKQTSYKEDTTNQAGEFGDTVKDTFKPKVVAVMFRFSYKIT